MNGIGLFQHSFRFAATRDSSNLLAHEAAFALGQMQDTEAIPALESVLNDLSLHPIVRHEVIICYPFLVLFSNLCYSPVISMLIYLFL